MVTAEHAPLLGEALSSARSKNVARMFAYNFMDGASFSVWQAQVLQVLVYQLSGNTAVGWVSGAAGVVQLVGAAVAGYSADVLRKEIVCRGAALAGLVAVLTSLYAVYSLYVPLFYISGGIWGIYMGLANSSSEALFADSIPSGQRTAIYSFKWVVQILCWCVGYVMCIVLFLKLGDNWTMSTMQTVEYVGLCMHPIALALLASMSDRYSIKSDVSLAEQEQQHSQQHSQEQDDASRNGKESDAATVITECSAREIVEAEERVAEWTATAGGSVRDPNSSSPRWCFGRLGFSSLTWRSTPYFVCFGDFLMALGSGMTLRFIPLFFVNDYNVSPSLLMVVFTTISVVTSLLAILIRKVAERFVGRVPAILAVRFLGTSLLMYMAVIPMSSPGAKLAVMLTFFVLRNGCMNCTLGMSRSVIMDCVPKENRAKWAAVESFSSFTWAGSATLGGYLADAHGYKYTFLITAVLHYGGCLAIVPAAYHMRKIEAVVMARERQKQLRAAAKRQHSSKQLEQQNPVQSNLSIQSEP